MKNDPQAGRVSEEATQSADIPKLTGHVLVVDDTRDTRLLFAAFLRIAGVRSSLAENGQIAYEKVMAAWESGRPFDLVLMDFAMPEVHGVTTTRRLRDAAYTGTIIIHTANAVIDLQKMCFEAGCDDYIVKPIRRDDFFALLSKYLPASRLDQNSLDEQVRKRGTNGDVLPVRQVLGNGQGLAGQPPSEKDD